MLQRICAVAAMAICSSPNAYAAVVLVSQSRTVSASATLTAPDFAAWNQSVSRSIIGINPPNGSVGSVTAGQNSSAITPTSMAGQLSVGFGALRVGNGGPAESRYEVVFDVVTDPASMRMSYAATYPGPPTFQRTARIDLTGPVLFSREGVGTQTSDLLLTPGRYTLVALTSTPGATFDGSFGANLTFGLTAIPAPSAGLLLLLPIAAGRRRRCV